MEAVKEEIRVKAIYPIARPELFESYGKRAGGGVLMYGPPGCGKTYLARATAGEIEGTFISVGLNDVLNLWTGSGVQNLHQIFEQARAQRPSVLFFDEVDALGATRSAATSGQRVVNQFLAEFDGATTSNEGVLILGATNAPWNVDSAFRRPAASTKSSSFPLLTRSRAKRSSPFTSKRGRRRTSTFLDWQTNRTGSQAPTSWELSTAPLKPA